MNLKLLLIVVALLNFFLPLSFVPLFDLDEGAFSEATREMLASGNYLTTYLNGDLRFDKPILIYWLQALSVKIFGLNEFALRLPSALAASLWAVAIWYFTKRYFNEKVAFYATLSMLASLQINLIAKAAIADALLNLFIALSLFALWIYLESARLRWLYIAFTAIALGFLTKGPVAILVPLATTFLYFLIKQDLKSFFKTIFNPVGIGIFLIIAMPWYILEYLDQGEKFINGFFLKHNLERFNTAFENHKGSFFYYLPVVLIGFLPFTTPLLKAFYRIKSFLAEPLMRFLLLWFLFVFLFFSFSGTKLPHYVIYGYTPLFLFIGLAMAKSKIHVTWSFLIPSLLLFTLLLFFPLILNYIPAKNSYYEALFAAAKEIFGLKFQIVTSLLILIFILLRYLRFNQEFKVVIIAILFGLYINMIVIRNYALVVQQPIKEAALYAKKHNLHVILYRFTKPSFLVYAEKLSPKREPKVGDYLLIQKHNLAKFKKYSVQYSKNGLYLIRIEK